MIDSRRHIFEGGVGSLWVKTLLWGFLSVITLGIFALFVPVKYLRWETENKIDNEHTTHALVARGEYRSKVHADAATCKAYQVEDDMESVKAGITDAMTEPELLALANSGVRSAQYTYVIRYAQGQYTQEPYSAMLAAAAQAEYAPAISLYLQTHSNLDSNLFATLLDKAVEKGQVWTIRAKMHKTAALGRSEMQDAQKLAKLQQAVYCADLLKELQPEVTAEDQALQLQCAQMIRRIQTKTPPRSVGKTIAAVIGVVLGVSLLIGGIAALIAYTAKLVPARNDFLDGASSFGNSMSGVMAGDMAGMAGNMAGNAAVENNMANEIVDQMAPTSSASTEVQNVPAAESDFWQRFTKQMEVDNCVLTQVDEASNGTIKYELTCDYWFWKSLHYVEVLHSDSDFEMLSLSGVRVYEPDSADPTMQLAQWESIIRVIYKELGLGNYDGITPYTQSGTHTETYGQWIFSYENTDQDVRLTVTKA